jgi:peptide/nickel transport system ATP-binding protein
MSVAQSTLLVEDLRTHFFTKAGVAKAVDGVSFTVDRGEVMGLVGESGSGKSVTGFSIMGLVDPPGRIVGGRVLFNGEDLTSIDEERMRQLRGNRLAMIFQDPMMTLNPVLRINRSIMIRRGAARGTHSAKSAYRHLMSGSVPIPTSSPAECVSVSPSL